jgi:hypothetical protein
MYLSILFMRELSPENEGFLEEESKLVKNISAI